MIVRIINKTSVKTSKKFFEKIAKVSLQKTKHKDRAEIFLVLTNDFEIKKLNKKYRRKNRITDVLSFPNIDLKREKFVTPEKENFYLGEIIISIPQAKRQAKEYRCSLKSELLRLFTHGILHLLGYDHIRKKDRIVMKKIEERIIENLKY